MSNNLLDDGARIIDCVDLRYSFFKLIQLQALLMRHDFKSICLSADELVAILLFNGVSPIAQQLRYLAAVEGGKMEAGQRRGRVVILDNFEAEFRQKSLQEGGTRPLVCSKFVDELAVAWNVWLRLEIGGCES